VTAFCLVSISRRAALSSPSISARRFFPAQRRGPPARAPAPAPKTAPPPKAPPPATPRRARVGSRGPRPARFPPVTPPFRPASRQLFRRLDVIAKRLHAIRQRWIGGIDGGAGPAHGRGRIDRGLEIIAERGAERGLVTLVDADVIERRRPELLGVDVQQLR